MQKEKCPYFTDMSSSAKEGFNSNSNTFGNISSTRESLYIMLTMESVARKPSHSCFFSLSTNPIFPNLYTIATFSIHLQSCSLNAIIANVYFTQCCSATNPSNLQVSKTHSHFKWIQYEPMRLKFSDRRSGNVFPRRFTPTCASPIWTAEGSQA